MSVISNSILAGSSGQGGAGAAGYAVERSLRFNPADSSYLNRTPSTAGNRRTWTISVWCKKTANGVYMPLINANNSTNPYLNIAFTNTDQIRWLDGSNQGQVLTDAVFRDVSAWYHFVIAVDTTLATATDRVKIYVNGVRQDVTFPTTVTQNHQTQVNATTEHRIGRWLGTSSLYLDGYLAEYILIDGQALTPSDFGEYDDNNVWQPKLFAGTYGTNGFHLDFSDTSSSAALGTDTSGNSNTWTVNNLSVAAGAGNDSLVDTPEQRSGQTDSGSGGDVVGNYATLNPLTSSGYTLSNGNLEVDSGSGSTRLLGTIGVTSGKYYFEAIFNSATSVSDSSYLVVKNEDGFEAGIRNRTSDIQYFTSSAGNLGTYSSTNWVTSETHGFALDCDNSQLKIYKNNSLTATISLTAGKTYFPGYFRDGTSASFAFNFGQRAFAYTAPSGYKALCTANLSDPTIADGSTAFDAVLYTGDGNSTQTISGLNFAPDLTWQKIRNLAGAHALTDSVRGVSAGYLGSHSTNAETGSSANGVSAFTSDGFTTAGAFNTNSNNWVTWAWDGGSSNTTIAAGSLNSSVYDQSQTWSNLVTGTLDTVYGNSSAAAPFQGTYGTAYTDGIRPANGAYLSMNFGTTFANATTVKLYGYKSFPGTTNANLKINGSNVVVADWAAGGNNATQGYATLTLTNGLTSLEWGYGSGGDSGYFYLENIEVDGKLLVDSGVTLPNVPAIASTVRANPSAGFSVVTWTATNSNATIGHGLGAAPSLIIVKSRGSSTANWTVYHSALGAANGLLLSLTSASSTDTNFWNNTSPTSTVFSVGFYSNYLTDGHVAYCFAPVEGYSAFGSYVGNANASGDGTFVYLGFRPKFIMIKGNSSYDAGGSILAGYNWYMYDSSRSTYNAADDLLAANKSFDEESAAAVDFLSNGFKIRNNSAPNANIDQYYIAFAEHPFKSARAR